MNEYFLKELNAITSYANNSDTVLTETLVRDMLQKLLEMHVTYLSNFNVDICEEQNNGKED